MKKVLLLPALLLLALGTTALVGPEPGSPPFTIVFEENSRPLLTYDRFDFDTARGWDFEDRDGYECANVARYDSAGGLSLLLDFEQSKDYVTAANGATFRINDRGGNEPGDGGNPPIQRPCGNELHGDPASSRWAPSGEDHFPHMTTHSDPATHGVRLYLNGVIDPTPTADLNAMLTNEDCDRAYWTPGDEPRELVLWWDVDFPENGHMDGTMPLDCGGGGLEPVAVARAYFAFMAPNVGVCILDHDAPGGQRCTGMVTPPPPPSPSPTPPACPTPNPKTGLCPPPKG